MKSELLKELQEHSGQLEDLAEQDYLSPEDVKVILDSMLALNRAVIDLARQRKGRNRSVRPIGEKMAMSPDTQPEMYLSERWDDY